MVSGAKQAKTMFEILRDTFMAFSRDECPAMAGALAYYTLFSLPPMLVMVVYIVGFVFEPEQIERAVDTQVTNLVGEAAQQQLDEMVERARNRSALTAEEEAPAQRTWSGFAASLVGFGALAFAATGVFSQLQHALNKAWNVRPDPRLGGARNFIRKRVTSFFMVAFIGVLLLVSSIATGTITAYNQALFEYLDLPSGIARTGLRLTNESISLLITALLFASIFKIMPDAKVRWHEVAVGAFATALLFTLGRMGISYYIANTNLASGFGAASSLAVLLVWTYYSALILFLGAEFTQVWATRTGNKIKPLFGAIEIKEIDADALV